MKKRIAIFLSLFITFCSMSDAKETLYLKSSAFENGKSIPKKFTCEGENIAPMLFWQGIPAHTKSLALIMHDPDALSGVWYHWIIFNISPNSNHIPDSKNGTQQLAKNSRGNKQYDGPCPPDDKIHHYIFTLYALTTKLQLSDEANIPAIKKTIQAYTITSATLTGLYKKTR